MTDVKYVSPAFHHRLKKSALHPGDVAVVRTGKPGVAACIPADAPEMNCSDLVVIRPGPLIDGRWLSYYINGAAAGYVSAQLVGAVQQHFNIGSARTLLVPFIPLARQRAIAEVLGAFDDKIAANTTLARTANDLAAAHFDAASSAGDWSGKTYSDIATVGGGGTPRTGIAEYWDGPVSWATPTDVTALAAPYLESTARTITVEGLAACSSPLYPAGSILMTSRATIGAFAINTHPTAVNQGFIVVNPYDNQLRWWLFHEMRSRVAEYLSHANGATFLELSRGRFKALPVCLIDQAGLATFSKTAEALHASARQAHVENRALGTLRDTLLPHLMSGKLRVKDAERQVEAVV